MKYIIMADGKGSRWQNYNEIPKHFAVVDGEPIILRTVRLLGEKNPGCEIIITSHDPRYDIDGAERYEPLNNVLEIDRFTEELIADDICFLYGDTYYAEEAIEAIISQETDDIHFFGTKKSIVAIKIKDGELFRSHVHRVRKLFLEKKIEKCIGWQVYRSFVGIPLDEKQIKDKFTVLDDKTEDFNTPEEYIKRKN